MANSVLLVGNRGTSSPYNPDIVATNQTPVSQFWDVRFGTLLLGSHRVKNPKPQKPIQWAAAGLGHCGAAELEVSGPWRWLEFRV